MSNATKNKPKAKRYVKRLNLSLAERAVILHACGEATQPASQMGGGMAAMFHLCEVQRELDEERLQEEIRVEFDRDRLALAAWGARPPAEAGPRPAVTTLEVGHADFKLYGTTFVWVQRAMMACKAWRGAPGTICAVAKKLGCDLSVFEQGDEIPEGLEPDDEPELRAVANPE